MTQRRTSMRFIMQVSFPPEQFNKAVLDGTVEQKMSRILEELKPEGAYFCAKDGNRGGYFIVNMERTSEMARYAEPWFLMFNATVEFLPTMTPGDLREAGLGDVGKKWR
jgi:Domain of unknown function (DUF3303)